MLYNNCRIDYILDYVCYPIYHLMLLQGGRNISIHNNHE